MGLIPTPFSFVASFAINLTKSPASSFLVSSHLTPPNRAISYAPTNGHSSTSSCHSVKSKTSFSSSSSCFSDVGYGSMSSNVESEGDATPQPNRNNNKKSRPAANPPKGISTSSQLKAQLLAPSSKQLPPSHYDRTESQRLNSTHANRGAQSMSGIQQFAPNYFPIQQQQQNHSINSCGRFNIDQIPLELYTLIQMGCLPNFNPQMHFTATTPNQMNGSTSKFLVSPNEENDSAKHILAPKESPRVSPKQARVQQSATSAFDLLPLHASN
jgi:hypothetical protein